MNKSLSMAAIGLALTVSSFAAAKPVQVTRFSAPGDVARGSAAPATAAASLEQSTYDGIVARELAKIGFGSEGNARFTYTVEVTQDTRRTAPRRSPVTIGIGGGSGGFGSGVGLGASFGIGGNRNRDVTVSRLAVVLRDRTSNQVVWEGRAEAESTKVGGEPVERLATALFRDFPGQSGRTISVK